MATIIIRIKTEAPRAALELAKPTMEMMFKDKGASMGVQAKDVKIDIED
jgi:hypothetical protein